MRWIAFLVLLLAAPVWAQAPTPPVQLRSQEWVGALSGRTAHADCRIQTSDGITCKLFLDARGLTPRATYSIWYLSSDNLMLPLLKQVTPLAADRHGDVKKSLLLNECPTDNQIKVVVRQEMGAGHAVEVMSGLLKRP